MLISFDRALTARVDSLHNYLARYWAGSAYTTGSVADRNSPLQHGSDHSQRLMALDLEALERIQYVRDRLLDVVMETERHVGRVIALVVDEIENDIRVARLLPPGRGWAWSARYDDWFCWSAGVLKWVSASRPEFQVEHLT